MSVTFVPRAAGAQRAGFLVVIGLHALVVLALLHGLARTAIERWNPPPVVQIVKPVEKPVVEQPTSLPKPNTPLPPISYQVAPDVPDSVQPPAEAVITRGAEPMSAAGASVGDPAATAAAPFQASPAAVPRPVARPTIGNVQACAPTGDDYPMAARRAEASGTTRLRFTVSAAGALVSSQVVRSAGPTRDHKLLDRVAESKLGGCAFSPGADESGRAIGGTFDVDYVWKLEN